MIDFKELSLLAIILCHTQGCYADLQKNVLAEGQSSSEGDAKDDMGLGEWNDLQKNVLADGQSSSEGDAKDDMGLGEWNDYVLKPSVRVPCCPEKSDRTYPVIYCYNAAEKTLLNLWKTAEVWISLQPEEFQVYWGHNPPEVRHKFMTELSILNMKFFFWTSKALSLNPFNSTCFGIVASKDYKLELMETNLNHSLELQFVVGLCLFLSATILAKSKYIYYMFVTTAGVLFSFLLVLYVLINLLPLKRTTTIGVFLGGGTLLTYFMNAVWKQISVFLLQHETIIHLYVATSAIISFFLFYNYAPPNIRRINTFKWIIQLIGMAMLYTSSYYKEAIQMIMALVCMFYYVPIVQICFYCIRVVVKWWIQPVLVIMRFFKLLVRNMLKWSGIALLLTPQPPALLTEEEYRLQGIVMTQTALNQLSQDFKNHKISILSLARLREPTAQRMISFLAGQTNHINPAEQAEHAAMYPDEQLTDDEN